MQHHACRRFASLHRAPGDLGLERVHDQRARAASGNGSAVHGRTRRRSFRCAATRQAQQLGALEARHADVPHRVHDHVAQIGRRALALRSRRRCRQATSPALRSRTRRAGCASAASNAMPRGALHTSRRSSSLPCRDVDARDRTRAAQCDVHAAHVVFDQTARLVARLSARSCAASAVVDVDDRHTVAFGSAATASTCRRVTISVPPLIGPAACPRCAPTRSSVGIDAFEPRRCSGLGWMRKEPGMDCCCRSSRSVGRLHGSGRPSRHRREQASRVINA